MKQRSSGPKSKSWKRPFRWFWLWWKPRRFWTKVGLVMTAFVMLSVGSMYGIAEWYIISNSGKPLHLGVTFIPDYARSFGLDPKDTLQAILGDLGSKRVRFVSYWEDIETSPGNYNFDELDWQMAMAQQAHVQVSLAVGLRQPRWPECHMPDWAASQPKSTWYPELRAFMTAVVNRYRDNPALQSYQLENEFFLKAFGQCTDFDRDRLRTELTLVHSLDPNHPVIISRSNNAVGLPLGKPTPDEFGVSVYKRVWDKVITHRYYEYPFPAWFYGFLAGAGKILTGKDMIIHELQAEPWMPGDLSLRDSSIAEQDKSMNAKRLKDRFQYGEASGIKTIDMWGVEWWYWRKVHFNDPSLWNVAKEQFQKANATLDTK